MRPVPDTSRLKATLADPRFGEDILHWLESLKTPQGYRLWSESPPNLLATSFAVFVRELLGDLPEGEEADWLAEALLAHRDSASGLFCHDPAARQTGANHDRHYLDLQQTHFALKALRCLGRADGVAMPFLENWKAPGSIRRSFEELDWSNPWLVSNNVMFLLYFLEHALQLGFPGPWRERIDEGLDWLLEHQRESGLWGRNAESRVYNAIYGAYHFLFFYLHWRDEMPGAARLLDWTRKLQTPEGFFAHNPGGGACEDYDCVDLLIKLGGEADRGMLLSCAEAVLESRDPKGAFCWARPVHHPLRFALEAFKPSLGLTENRKLFMARLRSILPAGRRWRYSGLKSLECPMSEADVWSTWFRLLILAEIDDHYLDSGREWVFCTFPSLGWHVSRKGMR